MSSIIICQLPDDVLLQRYQSNGDYVDCYCTHISKFVSQAEYIEAFYTTPLFKLERLVLKWLVSRPSTDLQARELALGHVEKFAAWRVEARTENEILMCDFQGRTRSWLMISPGQTEDGAGTELFFGSAVVHEKDEETGETKLGTGYQALLGFHKMYSRALLYSARSELTSH